jgi:hypothetical protein
MWGALSDKRTGLPFTITVVSRQRSHSRVWVPRDSWPYFSASYSRLPNLEGHATVCTSPGNRMAQVYPQELGSFLSPPTTRKATVDVLEPASTRGAQITDPVSESYVTTDSESASLSWNIAPMWGLRPDFCYSLTITFLFLWGALSDERTGQPFVYATGPRQRSPSWVPVPLVSWPYFLSQTWGFPFRRLLRLAGSRWRYSTPPPLGHGYRLWLYTIRTDQRETSLILVAYFCTRYPATSCLPRICFRGTFYRAVA